MFQWCLLLNHCRGLSLSSWFANRSEGQKELAQIAAASCSTMITVLAIPREEQFKLYCLHAKLYFKPVQLQLAVMGVKLNARTLNSSVFCQFSAKGAGTGAELPLTTSRYPRSFS